MHGWTAYLIVAAAIFGNNVLPAFGPPTWTLLVLFKFNTDIPVPALVVIAALSAGAGRFVLATLSRALRGRFSDERMARLQAAEKLLTGDRKRTFGGLALFMVSPLPSAQLFVAAGLLGMRLLPLVAAFVAGRLVTYSLYLGGATLAQDRFGDAVVDSITSPVGIALQVVLLAAIVAMVQVDWTRWLPANRKAAKS